MRVFGDNSFYRRSILRLCRTYLQPTDYEAYFQIDVISSSEPPPPFFLSYQPTLLEEQFSTVALYDLVSHTQYYCNNGRPSIEIGGDALKCCVSVCSAVCLEISSRQFRCGYVDPDLHMCFARSALILLTFTREIQSKQTLSHYKEKTKMIMTLKTSSYLHYRHILHHSSWQLHKDQHRRLDGSSGRETWDPLGAKAAAVHRPSFPDYPGSETWVAWSDVQPSVLPLSVWPRFHWSSRTHFSSNRSGMFCANFKAYTVTRWLEHLLLCCVLLCVCLTRVWMNKGMPLLL